MVCAFISGAAFFGMPTVGLWLGDPAVERTDGCLLGIMKLL